MELAPDGAVALRKLVHRRPRAWFLPPMLLLVVVWSAAGLTLPMSVLLPGGKV